MSIDKKLGFEMFWVRYSALLSSKFITVPLPTDGFSHRDALVRIVNKFFSNISAVIGHNENETALGYSDICLLSFDHHPFEWIKRGFRNLQFITDLLFGEIYIVKLLIIDAL